MHAFVTSLTRQLQDRVLNFQSKIERTIVPHYADQARLAAEMGMLSSAEKISTFESNLQVSAERNIPNARRLFERDREVVERIGKRDALEGITECLQRLFDISNLPHSAHPLFPICVASTYQWATSIVRHWPEIQSSVERVAMVQRHAEGFMHAVLNHPGDMSQMSLLEMHASFCRALCGVGQQT